MIELFIQLFEYLLLVRSQENAIGRAISYNHYAMFVKTTNPAVFSNIGWQATFGTGSHRMKQPQSFGHLGV